MLNVVEFYMDFVVETVCHQGQYGTMMKILSSFYFTCLLSLINSFNMANKRLQNTNQPMIENVLEKYSNIEGLQILALGSSFWKPPKEVFQHINIEETEVSKYGSILGLDSLRQLIRRRYEKKNLNMRDMDVVITAGANQGFTNIALALCDEGDTSSKI